MNTSSCAGCKTICCRCFPLRISPTDLLHRKDCTEGSDVLFAKENFIYLGRFNSNPLFDSAYSAGADHRYESRYYYTCRKLGLDGQCLDYANRPRMCREYGVNYSPDPHCLLYVPYISRLGGLVKAEDGPAVD